MNYQKKCGNMSRMVLVSLIFFFVLVVGIMLIWFNDSSMFGIPFEGYDSYQNFRLFGIIPKRILF